MMKRVEHHRLKPSSPFYAMLREFCHRSKNLYNHGNYLIRPVSPEAVFKQARFIPHGDEINLELVYEIPEVEGKVDNGKYAAIDIGVDNLAALAWNTGKRAVLLKGRRSSRSISTTTSR